MTDKMTEIELIENLKEMHPEHREQLGLIAGMIDCYQAQKNRDGRTLKLENDIEEDLQKTMEIHLGDGSEFNSTVELIAAIWLLQRRVKEAGARAMTGGALGGLGGLIGLGASAFQGKGK